jgi:hypothetical protein
LWLFWFPRIEMTTQSNQFFFNWRHPWENGSHLKTSTKWQQEVLQGVEALYGVVCSFWWKLLG